MKKSRFSEEQIIGILKEQEAGVSVAELCRNHAMSDPSFYTRKAKYGGLDVSETRRLELVPLKPGRMHRSLRRRDSCGTRRA